MRRTAFTLVELLVVIAIIALLLAVLAPSLRSSKEQARAISCGSNIKQLLIGLKMYGDENETFPYSFDIQPGQGPPPGGYAGNIAYDRTGWWWFNYISDYSQKNEGRNQAIWCPSRQIKDTELDFVLHSNYGANQSVCKSSQGRASRAEFIGIPLRESEIAHSSRTLLIVDSGYSTITWWHAADTPPAALGNSIIVDTAYVPGLCINKERDLWPGQERDAIYGRHPNKTVNAGFVDGHVDRTQADKLLVEETGDGYKNCSPLWRPK